MNALDFNNLIIIIIS